MSILEELFQQQVANQLGGQVNVLVYESSHEPSTADLRILNMGVMVGEELYRIRVMMEGPRGLPTVIVKEGDQQIPHTVEQPADGDIVLDTTTPGVVEALRDSALSLLKR